MELAFCFGMAPKRVVLRCLQWVSFSLSPSVIPGSQVLSEATEDNLIDLGPGSPAVVSNMVTSTVTPPSFTAPAARPSSPASLASRLAGLGMSSGLCYCTPQSI